MITSPISNDLAAFDRKLRALGESDRYWRLQRLRRRWQGTGYDGRPSFWDGSVPLRERAPAVQSLIGRTAGSRLVQLVFGDRVAPDVGVAAQAFGVALSDQERTAVLALVDEITDTVKLRRLMRSILTEGLECGTACVLAAIVEGNLQLQLVPPEWCTPTFGADGRTLAALVIEYKRLHTDGRLYLYRREIAPPRDVVYEPVLAERAAHAAIDWTKQPIAAEAACTFVPALWHRHNVEPLYGDCEIDGNALLEGLEDEVEALDLALSQLHRSALYNGEPQMVRTGVDPVEDEANLPRGRVARSDAGVFDRMFSRVTSWARGQESATQKSPARIWNLPSGGDAKLLESSGAGAGIIEKNVDALRRVIVDALGVVLADPAQLGSGELSARALSLLLAPMLAHADDLRVEYGDVLRSLLSLSLRLCHEASASGAVYLATLDSARPALARIVGATAPQRVLTLAWGEYFEPSWPEVSAAIDAAQKANGGRAVATLEESRSMVAPLLGLEGDASALAVEESAGAEQIARVISGDAAPVIDPIAPEGAAVADTALNGAQISSLVQILAAVTSGAMPVDSARPLILAAFPSFDDARVDAMLAPLRVLTPPAVISGGG